MSALRTAAVVSSLLSLTTLSAKARADVSVEACSDAYTKGQEERLAGRLFSARAQFKMCKEVACPNAIVEDCKRWAAEVEAELPTVLVSATNLAGAPIANLQVRIDGAMLTPEELGHPVVVDAGPHVFRLEAPGYGAQRIEHSMRPEDREFPIRAVLHPRRLHDKSLVASTPPAPNTQTTPTPFPIAAVSMAGIGAVALGGAVYFGISAKHRYDQLAAECAPHCTAAQADSVRSKVLLSDIALATSLVAFGASALFYFSAKPDAKATALSVEPRADGANLRLRFAF